MIIVSENTINLKSYDLLLIFTIDKLIRWKHNIIDNCNKFNLTPPDYTSDNFVTLQK